MINLGRAIYSPCLFIFNKVRTDALNIPVWQCFLLSSWGSCCMACHAYSSFALCCLAIAYRYYSAFLAAKVACLDDSKVTPAHLFNDGQNYHPTNRWVLFGHHFAAISGAGPLIGPVLAIQYGYMPGLLWLVIGVCLAGAVQDMLVLAASVRRGGKSLAEIAKLELGPLAGVLSSAAILFIVIIALAGLGFVVVKALGGETIPFPKGTKIDIPAGEKSSLTLLDPTIKKPFTTSLRVALFISQRLPLLQNEMLNFKSFFPPQVSCPHMPWNLKGSRSFFPTVAHNLFTAVLGAYLRLLAQFQLHFLSVFTCINCAKGESLRPLL